MSINRRTFLGAAFAATGALAFNFRRATSQSSPPATPISVDPKTVKHGLKATSRVALGKSGIKVSLVGIGTGTYGSGNNSNQTRLGDEGFKTLMHHAFDHDINFFDLADSYGSGPYFGRAMKGIARDKYVLQSKVDARDPKEARQRLETILRELNTDYLDSFLVHCVSEGDWTTRYAPLLSEFEKFKSEGKIRAHGVTCHSFEALQIAGQSDWVQVHQVRWNAYQSHMDNDVATCRDLFAQMRRKGQGMIGMKVVGEGNLVNGKNAVAPAECFRHQIESGVVDAFVVGCEKPEHIDQLLAGTQKALDELGYRTKI